MSHTSRTLLLDAAWDITLDSVGHIALTREAAAVAQNVANECRLFTDDAYFARDRGIPHFLVELGASAPESAFRTYLRRAALGVEGVAEVTSIVFDALDSETRTLSGELEFSTVDGEHVAFDF